MAKTLTRKRPKIVQLREDFARSSGALRVNREEGVIYGVKVLGFESVNGMEDMPTVERRVYSKTAVAKAKGLYEGCHVSIDHPQKPGQQRSAYDRFGVLEDIEIREDGLYANLRYLKSHPLAERIVEAAERMPDAFGFSHSADARGERRGDAFVVTEIVAVNSVDLVADPATTNGLFESRQGAKKMAKVKEEYDGHAPAMEDDEMDGGYEEHLSAAIGAILKDDGIDFDAKKKKIVHLISTMEKGETTEEDEAEEKDLDKAEGGKKDTATEESEGAEVDLQKDAEHAKGDRAIYQKAGSKNNAVEALQSLRSHKDPAIKALVEHVIADRQRTLERLDHLETKARLNAKRAKAHKLCEAARLPKEAMSKTFIDQLTYAVDDKHMRELVEDRRQLAQAKKPRSLGKVSGQGMKPESFAEFLRNGHAE
jgi:hypothetical protein